MVFATRSSRSRWSVHPPLQVIDPAAFFSDLLAFQPGSGCILAGFDFPIGLPYQYARKAGIQDYLSLLPELGSGIWRSFYEPARTPDEISLHRPFYPARPGNSSRSHLERGLNLPFSQLFRLCEIAHENRRAACPLFWTLGAQQVGKAALHGWKNLLKPALSQPDLNLKLWPFSGSLAILCQPGNIVATETYPAEFYGHLGILSATARMSKRRQEDRMVFATRLNSYAAAHRLDLEPTLQASIDVGFGDSPDSEDSFDALVGLYGMINVIQGNHPTGEPVPAQVSTIEGWIFGQVPPGRTGLA